VKLWMLTCMRPVDRGPSHRLRLRAVRGRNRHPQEGQESRRFSLAFGGTVKATDYNSVVGPLKWTGEPVKNVTKTPLVAGQWRKMDNIFNLVVCENKTAFEIPVQAKLNLLS